MQTYKELINDGNVIGIICAVQCSAVHQYLLLILYSHSDPQYLYYKHVYPSHGQG
jgi:hypothetical protein